MRMSMLYLFNLLRRTSQNATETQAGTRTCARSALDALQVISYSSYVEELKCARGSSQQRDLARVDILREMPDIFQHFIRIDAGGSMSMIE